MMLKALLRERHLQSYGRFKRAYQKAAKAVDKDLVETYPSRATLYRWLEGQVQELPYPDHFTSAVADLLTQEVSDGHI
ncbi:MAG TPA: hypothetical protein VFQ77_01355 [Pseudonocardiaceae bacterium]|jgi:hypothetical protein|nr:hypothetical protein [Pseudonocardiaceae bacterium]